MPTVIVDDKEIEIGENERLNGIQVAARAGVDIPRYCWHEGLSVVASCRMCLVEAGKKDPATGKVTMQPRVVPACQTPATPDTVFITNSEKVKNARAMVEEDLLLRHPVDCPICDKAGECSLQDYHFEHGRDERRADIKPFTSRRRELGDTVTLFVDRCVMCTRCVRFCREASGTKELMVINRGAHEEIDVFRDEQGEIRFPLDNKLSGNVVDLCPVGALGDKDFLYKQRVWFMKSHDNVCAGCSTGCSMHVEENQDRIHRLKPRTNMQVNTWWMCDEGRYGWKHVHDEHRVTELRRRDGTEHVNVEWSQLPAQLEKSLRAAGRLAGVVSPHLTVEEAYLFCQYIRSIDPNALLVLGRVNNTGNDERFANGFTIHGEKCPNRRGVEKIIHSMGGNNTDWTDFLFNKVNTGDYGGVFLTSGDHSGFSGFGPMERDYFARVGMLVVQDCFSSSLWERANFQLPSATFAEREGSYVNFNDILQSFPWAIRPPEGVVTEGQLYWQLLKKPGLYSAAKVLADIAREIAFFAPAAQGVPETGLDLKINQLAEAGSSGVDGAKAPSPV